MNITNLVQIKNYEAGKNGNLLVALDDNLVQTQHWSNNKKVFDIRMLLCTAYVDSLEAQDKLREYTDGSVPVNRIIVVSRKFMRLFNKTQLILLYERNVREDVLGKCGCYEEIDSYGKMETVRKYGKFRSKMAFDKERKLSEKDIYRTGKAMKRYDKKVEKEVQKGTKDAANIVKNMSKEDIQDIEEDIMDMFDKTVKA